MTSGILQAAYTTDLTSNQGSWWQGAYPLPDLALNHPARWSVSAGYTNAGASCRPTNNPSRPYSCATLGLNDASPENLWNSDFFWMKGLLITPATGPAEGPQLSEATAGDQVRLQARVYNYSLKSMAGNVTVQFYGQPWDTSNNTPIGNSFLIENVELGPIPAYGGSEPNWQVAETTRLDTAAYSDQHLIFWMLVVLKDAQGNPLPEMSGHGLTGVPPTVNSFTEAATWIEPYSNNLGYYHSAFYIAPQNAGLGATARAPVGEGNLAIKRFTAEPKRALLNKPVSVSAVLRVGDLALDHVVVSFYDGDPAHGGRLFDEERLAHIRAHEVAEARVPFRAETCGVHTLYVKTYPQVNTAKTTLSVRSKPLLPTVQGLISQTRQLALPRHKHDKNNYLLDLLYEARQSIKHHDITGALNKLAEYRVSIEKMRGHTIPAAQADQILAQLGRISSCTG